MERTASGDLPFKRRYDPSEAELPPPKRALDFDAGARFAGEEDGAPSDDDVEPFNLDQERDEGDFDADGNYVRFRRRPEEADGWIDMVENERVAAVPQGVRETAAERERRQDARLDALASNRAGFVRQLVALMTGGETAQQCICRLKKEGRPDAMAAAIDACGSLVELGEFSVYSSTRDELARQL